MSSGPVANPCAAPIFGRIYLATNLVNGKKYVGKTAESVEKRRRLHSISKYALGRAICKYGERSFSWKVIDTALNDERLNSLEIAWIKFHDCRAPKGYNLAEGGLGGSRPLPSTRAKLSRAAKAFQVATGQLKAARKTVDENKRLARQAAWFRSHKEEMRARIAKTILKFPDLLKENGHKAGKKFSGPGGMDRIRAVAQRTEYIAKRKASIAAHQKANPEFWSENGRLSGLKNVRSGHIFRLNHIRYHEKRGVSNPACEFCKANV